MTRLRSLVLGLTLTLVWPAQADEITVPVAVQVPLLLKVLKYERGFPARLGDELVLGVAYQERYRASFNARNEFRQAVDAEDAERLFRVPYRIVDIALGDPAALAEAIERAAVDVLYVAPLRAVAVEDVAAAIRGLGVVTFAAVPEYVVKGLVVGVTARRNRPSLLINLSVAKEEGFDFSSQLLSIAQIVD